MQPSSQCRDIKQDENLRDGGTSTPTLTLQKSRLLMSFISFHASPLVSHARNHDGKITIYNPGVSNIALLQAHGMQTESRRAIWNSRALDGQPRQGGCPQSCSSDQGPLKRSNLNGRDGRSLSLARSYINEGLRLRAALAKSPRSLTQVSRILLQSSKTAATTRRS